MTTTDTAFRSYLAASAATVGAALSQASFPSRVFGVVAVGALLVAMFRIGRPAAHAGAVATVALFWLYRTIAADSTVDIAERAALVVAMVAVHVIAVAGHTMASVVALERSRVDMLAARNAELLQLLGESTRPRAP